MTSRRSFLGSLASLPFVPKAIRAHIAAKKAREDAIFAAINQAIAKCVKEGIPSGMACSEALFKDLVGIPQNISVEDWQWLHRPRPVYDLPPSLRDSRRRRLHLAIALLYKT